MLPIIDKTTFQLDSETTLRAPASAAMTIDTTGSSLQLKTYDDGLPTWFLLILEDMDITDGDETYEIYLEESPDDAAWTEVQGSRIMFDASTGFDLEDVLARTFGLGPMIRQAYVRFQVDVGGTTPSITCALTLTR